MDIVHQEGRYRSRIDLPCWRPDRPGGAPRSTILRQLLCIGWGQRLAVPDDTTRERISSLSSPGPPPGFFGRFVEAQIVSSCLEQRDIHTTPAGGNGCISLPPTDRLNLAQSSPAGQPGSPGAALHGTESVSCILASHVCVSREFEYGITEARFQ